MANSAQAPNLVHKSLGVEGCKVLDDEKGIIEAFVSGIGNKDSGGDIIVPGAFDSSLQQRIPKGVWSHDWDKPVSKTLEIYEVPSGDERLPLKMQLAGIGGLYVKTQFNLATQQGRDAYETVKFFGEESEWSIGYQVEDAEYDHDQKAMILKQISLYEYSPVLFGMNELTSTVSIKAHKGDDGSLEFEVDGLEDVEEKAVKAALDVILKEKQMTVDNTEDITPEGDTQESEIELPEGIKATVNYVSDDAGGHYTWTTDSIQWFANAPAGVKDPRVAVLEEKIDELTALVASLVPEAEKSEEDIELEEALAGVALVASIKERGDEAFGQAVPSELDWEEKTVTYSYWADDEQAAAQVKVWFDVTEDGVEFIGATGAEEKSDEIEEPVSEEKEDDIEPDEKDSEGEVEAKEEEAEIDEKDDEEEAVDEVVEDGSDEKSDESEEVADEKSDDSEVEDSVEESDEEKSEEEDAEEISEEVSDEEKSDSEEDSDEKEEDSDDVSDAEFLRNLAEFTEIAE